MNWIEGRQGGGYHKLKLLESKRFKFDVYLLKFDPLSDIHAHKDECPDGYSHHRLNVVLKKASGKFWTEDKECYWTNRIHKFMPSEVVHGMDRGTRSITGYWLSIGWLRKK